MGGKMIDTVVGAVPKNALKSSIDKHVTVAAN
jgi:hypothetical protein